MYGGDTLRLTHSSRKRRDVSNAKAHAEEYNVVVEKEPGAATADFKEPREFSASASIDAGEQCRRIFTLRETWEDDTSQSMTLLRVE